MRGAPCYQKGKEHGPWYEIKCTADVIRSKEARGEDASFERELLRSWAKYPSWEDAGNALNESWEIDKKLGKWVKRYPTIKELKHDQIDKG